MDVTSLNGCSDPRSSRRDPGPNEDACVCQGVKGSSESINLDLFLTPSQNLHVANFTRIFVSRHVSKRSTSKRLEASVTKTEPGNKRFLLK